jgi:hypothetical protein
LFGQCGILFGQCGILFGQCGILFGQCGILFGQCGILFGQCGIFLVFNFIAFMKKIGYRSCRFPPLIKLTVYIVESGVKHHSRNHSNDIQYWVMTYNLFFS